MRETILLTSCKIYRQGASFLKPCHRFGAPRLLTGSFAQIKIAIRMEPKDFFRRHGSDQILVEPAEVLEVLSFVYWNPHGIHDLISQFKGGERYGIGMKLSVNIK